MRKWRTDDIPHPLTGWKPEDQTNNSRRRRRATKSGGAKPPAFSSRSGFSPNVPSISTSSEPITFQDGKGKGSGEGKGPNVCRATEIPTGRSTHRPASAEKPEPYQHPNGEKGTKLPEPDTSGLGKKAPGLTMPPRYRTAKPSAGNPLCLEICNVKSGGLGCPYCNPDFKNVFVWADYIGRVDKCIPPPVRVDLKTGETEEWVTYFTN